MREAVDAELHARKNDESRSVKLIEELQSVYHQSAVTNTADTTSIQSKMSKSSASSRMHSNKYGSLETSSQNSVQFPRPIKKKSSVFASPTKEPITKNTMAATSSDWVTKAVSQETSQKMVPQTPYSVKIDSGEVMLYRISFENTTQN